METQPLGQPKYEPPPDYQDGGHPLPPPEPPGGYQAITKQPVEGAAVLHHVAVYEDSRVEPFPSLWCPILLACWVFWCISPLFGLAAFFVGCLARGSYNPQDAQRLKRASIWLSVAGMIISLVVALIVVILHFTIGLGQPDT